MEAEYAQLLDGFGTAKLTSPEQLPTFVLKPHVTVALESNRRLRDVPYVTRGRDLETAIMAQSIQGAPSSIQLITAAPGAGKSALMENIKQLALAWGCTVVALDRQDFHDDLRLAKAIWRQGRPPGRGPARRSVVETEHVSAAPAGVGSAGTRAESTDFDVDHPDTWADAILAVAAANQARPTAFFLDEVQRLDRESISAEEWSRAEQFLQFFQARVFSMPAGTKPRTVLICAGLLNAQDVLNSFNISRVEGEAVMRLGPLSADAARTILHDHMTARTRMGQPLPELPGEPAEALIQASGGSAHHIAVAGLAAQREAERAQNAGLSTLDANACERILEGAQNGRTKLYKQRITPADGSALAAVAMAIAQATLTHGTELGAEEAQALIHRVNQAHNAPHSDILEELQRKGIIELRTLEDEFPTRAKDVDPVPRYAFGIPSMATWLNERRQVLDRSGARTNRNDVAIRETMGPADDSTILPPWTWNHSKPLPELEPMPTADRVTEMNERVQQGLTAVELPPSEDEGAGRSASEIALDVSEEAVVNLTTEAPNRLVRTGKRIYEAFTGTDDNGSDESTKRRIARGARPKQLPPNRAARANDEEESETD